MRYMLFFMLKGTTEQPWWQLALQMDTFLWASDNNMNEYFLFFSKDGLANEASIICK